MYRVGRHALTPPPHPGYSRQGWDTRLSLDDSLCIFPVGPATTPAAKKGELKERLG